jgi:hypothetical protein
LRPLLFCRTEAAVRLLAMLERPPFARRQRGVAKDSRAAPENWRHCIFHWPKKAQGVQAYVSTRQFVVARDVL